MTKVIAWRIVQQPFAKYAFDGEGARRYGGRWNSKGNPMVYTSSSLALAVLEILVNLQDSDTVRENYVKFKIDIPATCITKLSPLPKTWLCTPAPNEAKHAGDQWIAEGVSVALSVPSAVVPEEHNYLINPRHADFDRLTIRGPSRLLIDTRLL